MKRIARGFSIFAVGWLCVGWPMSAQVAPFADVVFVEPLPQTSPAASATAFTIADRSGHCVLLSVYHVNKDALAPSVRIKDLQNTFDSKIDAESVAADVLITASLNAKYFGGCPGLPSGEEIGNRLRSSAFEIVSATSTGELLRTPVAIVKESQSKLTLRATVADQRLHKTMSGSPLVTNGLVVGILQEIDSDSAGIALRLDALPGNILEKLSSEASTGVAKNETPLEPFDVAQLPAAIQKLVLDARKVRKLSESAAEEARREAARARVNAARADEIGAEGRQVNGVARFRAKNENYYKGAVVEVERGTLLRSYGYGVSEVREGAYFGDKYLCAFDADGICQGLGVAEYGSNPARVDDGWARWEGELKAGKERGYGIMYFVKGLEHYWLRAFDRRDRPIPSPGVWIFSDERVFEGMMSKQIEHGALWTKEGRLICFGFWTEHNPDNVKNRKAGYPDCN